jgi:hypothetical protein
MYHGTKLDGVTMCVTRCDCSHELHLYTSDDKLRVDLMNKSLIANHTLIPDIKWVRLASKRCCGKSVSTRSFSMTVNLPERYVNVKADYF